jgi:hypothetical protein
MGAYYDQLADIRQRLILEGQARRALSVLQHPPKDIGTSDLLRLRTALADAKQYESLLVGTSRAQLRRSQQLGIVVKPYDPAKVKEYCSQGAAPD